MGSRRKPASSWEHAGSNPLSGAELVPGARLTLEGHPQLPSPGTAAAMTKGLFNLLAK